MEKRVFFIKSKHDFNFFSIRMLLCFVFCVFLFSGAFAQGEIYDIISARGTIKDKSTGKTLEVGDKIYLDTELEFGALYDRAVLLSSSKSKYFLEVPKSSLAEQQLVLTSSQALSPVQSKSRLVTGVRGSDVLKVKGLSPETLKEYFGPDAFTVIGTSLKLPVKKQDADKYCLLLRYEKGNSVEEYISNDLSIEQKDLKLEGNGIAECYLLLKEGNETVHVTQVSLFFVSKTQLFKEFDSLLKSMNQKKKQDDKTNDLLKQYCLDVYGMMDRESLENTIEEYLK